MQTHRKGFHCSRESHSNETTQRVHIRQLTVLYRLHCFRESEKEEKKKWKKKTNSEKKKKIGMEKKRVHLSISHCHCYYSIWTQRLLRSCCCRQCWWWWWFGSGVGNIVRFIVVVNWIYYFMHKTSITLIQLSDCTNQPTNSIQLHNKSRNKCVTHIVIEIYLNISNESIDGKVLNVFNRYFYPKKKKWARKILESVNFKWIYLHKQ